MSPVLTYFALPWRRLLKVCRAHPVKAVLGSLALLVVPAVLFADVLLAGPMRTWAETMMNSKLSGYTVHIGRARPRLWKLAFALENLTVVQNRHPDPPVAEFGALEYSMVMKELLHGKVAGDLTFLHPALHLNLAQLNEEAGSHASLKDRGWQSAVEAIYPIKLSQVRILDGSLLYLAPGTEAKPIQLTKVSLVARNVRNIAVAKDVFPSPLTLEGVLFDAGKVSFLGAADFLREPSPALEGAIHLEHVPLDRLGALARAYQLETKGGFLSVDGSVVYTPGLEEAHLREVLFDGLRVDFITSKATQTLEARHGREAARLAKSLRNAPKLVLQVDRLELVQSEFGFMDESARPPYRLFVTKAGIKVTNLSNHNNSGRSSLTARGDFMGHGATVIKGDGRLAAIPADFHVGLTMEKAWVTDLNPCLRALAGVDMAAGQFSVYSEFTVQHGRVDGYVKPLLVNLKIYDPRKDRGKPFGKRVELHALQFFATLLKNRSSREVATVTRVSGSTSAPKASEWQTIRRLIGNGLFRAILPGLVEDTTSGPSSNRPRGQAVRP